MKIFLFTLQLVALSLMVSAQGGEWVSASIGNGVSPNKVDLFIQTTTTFDANKCDNLVFTIRVPITGGNLVTVAESYHSPAFAHISFQIDKLNVTDGTFYYYLINGIGSVQAPAGTNIVGGAPPVRVLELTFNGGSNAFVQLANIENDIPGNIFIRPQFYIQFNNGELTNLTAMFFGTAGAVPHNNTPPDGDDWVPTSGNVVLPVLITKYDVRCNDKGVLLTWSTATEQNSRSFEIQRSTNGSNWVTIDNVAAAGNSAVERNYQYVDLYGGSAFYRIRQVDNDGRFIYTAVKHTDCKTNQVDITLYPVPARDKLNVIIKSDIAVKTELQILDMSGRIVSRTVAQVSKGNNNIILNVNDLPGGQYMLVSSDASIVINQKFTVIR